MVINGGTSGGPSRCDGGHHQRSLCPTVGRLGAVGRDAHRRVRFRSGRDRGWTKQRALRNDPYQGALQQRLHQGSQGRLRGDDQAQEIRLGDLLREGEQTAPIDLAGGERFIKRIEIAARTRGRRRAVVEIYAIPAPAWERIGSRNVRGHGVNLSTFLVPRGMGPFTSVRLQVKRRDVYILGLRVAFKNGKAQDIRVRRNIRKGKSTRPFDLSGFNRGIEHIEVVYRARPGFRRRARRPRQKVLVTFVAVGADEQARNYGCEAGSSGVGAGVSVSGAGGGAFASVSGAGASGVDSGGLFSIASLALS